MKHPHQSFNFNVKLNPVKMMSWVVTVSRLKSQNLIHDVQPVSPVFLKRKIVTP